MIKYLKYYFNLLFIIVVFVSCESKDGFIISSDDSLLQGRVVKGPVSNSLVTVYKVDDNTTLGTATTNFDGRFTLDIGGYEGLIKVVSTGGSYIDEATNNTVASTSLRSFTSISSNDMIVIVSPFTQSAAIQIENMDVSQLTTQLVKSTNENFISSIMGLNFNPAKADPKIFDTTGTNPITNDDGISGEYGIALALFSQLLDNNNSLDVESLTEQMVNDVENDTNGSAVDMINALDDLNISDDSIMNEISSSIATVINPSSTATISGLNIKEDLLLNTVVQFDLNITGIELPEFVTIDSNGSFLVKENGSSSFENAVYVNNNAIIRVFLQTSNEYNTSVTTTINVGSVEYTLTATTLILPTINTLFFSDDNNITYDERSSVNFTGSTTGIENNQEVFITIGSITQTAIVTNNEFNSTIDLSTLEDNNYAVLADASNSSGISAIQFSMNITILPEIDLTPPVWPSSYNINIDENETFSYELNATDNASTTLIYSIVGGLDEALFSLNGSTLTFLTNKDFENPTDNDFDNIYEVVLSTMDEANNETNQSVAITINNVIDEAPVLGNPIAINIDENISSNTVIFQVLKDGNNSDENTTDAFYITNGNDGNFTIDSNGEITVSSTSNLDFGINSSYTLTITASNDGGTSESVTLTININNVNEITAIDDNATLDEDSNITINVLNNDLEEDNKQLTVSIATNASNGTAILNNNQIIYTPNENYFGVDTIEYTVSNNEDEANATVNIVINQINDTPTILNPIANQTAYENNPFLLDTSLYFTDANDTNDTLTFTATNLPSWATIDSNGTITGTPTTASSSVTVTIKATDSGTSPSFVNSDFNLSVDSGFGIASMEANVSEAKDNDTVEITLNFTDDVNISIANTNDFNISFDINGTIVDATASITNATNVASYKVLLTIPNSNNLYAEFISINSLFVSSNSIISSTLGIDLNTDGVGAIVTNLIVDTIPPTLTAVTIESSNENNSSLAKIGDTITIDITASEDIQTPQVKIDNHVATVTGSNTNFTATYTVDSNNSDGNATILIDFNDTVGNVGTQVTTTTNDSFVIIDKTPPVWPSSYNINIDENETFSYELNATDNASTTLIYSIVGGLDEALFSLNGSTLTFLTNKDFENPTDNDFDNIYEVVLSTMDEANNETNQSVAITINNVIDEAPVLGNPIAINIDENISSNTVIFQVLKDGNNSDENTTDAFYITNGNDGNFTIDSNGEITVSSTSNLDFGINSSYTLTITASNDGGTSESVTLTININNVNEITAIDDNATLDEDSNITINVLNNDLEEDNKQLTVSIATNASNGTAILNNNQIIYTPNENYFGVDTIEYTVSNNEDEANATVNIVINQINDTPTILNPIANQTAYENNPFLLDTSLYFTDANDTNDTLTFTATNLPSWATIDSNGTITGTPTTASSSVTVTIKATDSGTSPSFVNSDFNLSVDSGFGIASMEANVSEAKDNDTVEITLNFTDDVNISIANTNDFNISFDINGTIVDATASITNATNVASYKVFLTIPNSNNLYDEFISINSLFVSSNSIISSTRGIDLNTDGVGAIVTNLIVDTIPPTLTSVLIESSNENNSSLAKIGDLITINITASEDIQTPQVKINGHVATISIESNTSFTAAYTVDSNNSDGNATILIDFNDTVGNVGTQVTTTTHDSFVTIDKTPPTLTDVSIESNNTDSSLAKIGDLITIDITALEDIQTPQVKIDNHVATVTGSNTNFTATYTVDSNNSDGNATISIDFNDTVGNVGTQVTTTTNDSFVTIDKTPPTLTVVTIESNNTDSSLAKIGDTITIDITALEDIQTPQVKIDNHVATVTGSNTNFTATYTVDSNNSDGNATISIDFNDTVGNAGTQVTTTTNDSFVTIDTIPPTLTVVTIESNNTDSSLAKIGDLITIDITASEDIQTPQVKINGHVATISIESNTNFTATYTVDSNNSDGNATILIDFNDTVGNVGTQVTTTTNDSFVTIDKTPPTLTVVTIESNNTDSSLAKIGDTITIDITALEDIQTPQVKIDNHVASVTGSNTNFTATYTVDSNNSDGNATISIDFNDTVGNVGTQVTTTTNDSFVTIDKTPPTLTVVTIESNNTDSSLAKIGDTITIDITALEDIQTPQVKIDNHVASVTGSNTNFTATYTVDSNNSDGNATISIDFNDTVGNVGTQVTTTTNDSFVTIDKTPPTLTVVTIESNNTDSSLAKIGDTITIDITASEDIQTPQVKIDNHVATVTGSNTNFTATYTVDSNNSDGNATILIDFNDTVGNAGTQVTTTTNDSFVTIDKTPPTLTVVSIESNNTDSSLAKIGDTITIDITALEDIQTPQVKIDNHVASVTGSNTNFTATYTVDSNNSDGNATISIDFNDTVGNAGTQVTTTTNDSFVIIDATPPELTSVLIESSNENNSSLAKIGDTITIDITALEDIQTPQVKIDNHVASVTGSNTNFTATYTVDSNNSDGNATILIDFNDTVGNAGTQVTTITDDSFVTIDKTPPELTSVTIESSNENNSSLAKIGDTITIDITALEDIQTPQVKIDNHVASVTGSNTNFTATYTVDSNNSDGNATILIDFNDTVGNVGTQVTTTTHDSFVIIDTTVPTLTDVSIESNNTDSSLAKIGDLITIDITASEDIQTPQVKIDNHVATVTGSNTNFTATYTVDSNNSDGNATISIDFNDTVGNVGTQVTTTTNDSFVTIDKTPPTLTVVSIESNNTDSSLAKIGDTITIDITALEDIQTPQVKIDNHVATVTGSNTNFTATYTVDSNNSDGNATILIDFNDTVGNAGTQVTTTTNDSFVTIDKTPPTLTVVTIESNNTDSSLAKIGDLITIDITALEDIQTPQVKIDNHVATVTGSNTNFTATYTVDSNNSDGNATISIDFNDTVGNVGTQVTTTTNDSFVTIDKTPPTLTVVTIESNNTDSSLAKIGDTITIDITASEDIQTPQVKIDNHVATVTGSNTNFTATYTVDSNNSDGNATISIDFNDTVGNVGTQVTTTTNDSFVTIDKTPPTLTVVTIESNNTDSSLAKIGDTITIDITALEDIQTPQVKIDNHVATVTGSNTNFTATYTVDSNNSDGNATISIDFNDTVGNVGTQVTTTTNDSFVTIDKTPPTLTVVTIESNNTDSSLAKIGDTITIDITALEDIQTPQVKIDNHVASVTGSNTNFTATYTVDSNNSDGNATISIDFNDTVGNAGTQVTTTTNDSFVTIDKTPPTLTVVTIESNNTDSSLAKIGDLITIDITALEDIQTPQVKIDNHVATVTGSNTNFTATYTVDSNNSDGNATISIDFNDTVGNVGTQVTTTTNDSFVTIDKTPPTLTVVTIESNNTDSSLAKIGDLITIDITASEDIQTPQVKIDNHVATVTGSNTNFTATYTVDSNNSDGNATISIDFNDTVGNVGTQVTTTTNDSFVTIDTTVPTLTDVSIESNNTDSSLAKIGDLITIDITASEDIQTPQVKIDNHVATVTGSNTNFTATYTVDSNNSDGNATISIDFNDTVGNVGTQVTTTTNDSFVTIDKTPPTLTVVTIESNNTDSSLAKIGDLITIDITALEDIQTPQVKIDNHVATVTGSNTNFTATYTVDSNNSDGNATISIDFNDTVGNVGTQVTTTTNDSFVTIDKTPPTLTVVTIESNNTDSSLAKIGDTITIDITALEDIQTPQVKIDNHVASVTGSNTNFTATYTVDSNNSDGNATISIDFNDTVGNVGTQVTTTTNDSFVTIDTTVPTLLSFEATTTNTLYNTTNSTIVIKATMNEDIMSGDTITIVLNTGNSVILTANSDSTTLEGNYTVGIGEAAQPLNVLNFTSSITDLAGNEFQNNVLPNINLIDSNISIDTLRPTVLSISSSGAYQDSDDYNITVIFDQELNISTLDATSMNLNVDLNVTGTTETVVAMHQSSQIIGEQTHALYSFVVLSNHLDTDGPVVTSVNDFDNITNNQNINLDYDLNSLLLDGKIVGANPSLIGFEINDTDNSETYNAGDTIVLTFSSILKINTFTTNGITFSNGYELAANNITPNENSNTYILTLGESSNLNANDVITISKDNIEDTFGNFALNDGIVLLSDLARPSFALANAIEVFDEDNTSTYSQGDTIDITFSEMIKVSDFSNTVIDGLSAYSITQENGGSNEYYYKFTITLNDNLSTLTNNGGSVLVFSKDNIIDEDNLSPNMDLNITVPNIIKIASTDINVTHASDGYSVGDTVSLYFNVEVNASELTTSDILIDGTALSDSSITKHTNYIDIIIGSSDLMYFVEDSIISISSNFIFDADGIQMINTAQYTLPDITAPTGSSESALPGDLNDNDTLDEGDTLTLLFSEVIDTSLINLTNIATVSDVNFGTGATVNTDNTYDSEIVITLGNDTNASGATITIPQEQIIDNVENEALNDISFSVINLNTPIIDDIIIDDNAYGSGDEINVTVLFSKNIDVTENGVITIDLKIGSSTVKATYNENNISSNNMVFTYYASGVIDTDGIDVIANSITTNGSTIKFSSYDANLNFVTKNFPGATVYAPFSVSTASTVWFDGTDVDGDGDTTNQTSGSISQWNDKSGNNNHVEQSDSSLQPILQSDSSFTNNKASVYFNGSNYMLVRGNQIGSNISYSWFVSASATTANGEIYASVFNTRTDQNPHPTYSSDGAILYALENQDSNTMRAWIYSNGNGYMNPNLGAIDYGNSMLLGDSAVAGSYRNLYYKGEKTEDQSVSPIVHGQGITIGAVVRSDLVIKYYLDGYVNEILFYNRALTDAETVIVQNYIASKWNNEIDSSANYYDGDENAIGDYDDYVTGIVKLSTSAIDAGKQGGVTIVNDGFVQAAGDSILIGNKGDDSIVFDSTFYPSSTNYKKLNKTWYMDIKSNTVDNEGGIKLIFDLSKFNSILETGSASDYALLYASNENGVYTKIANASSMDGSNIEFELTAKTSGTIHENGDTITTGYFTISSSNDSLLASVDTTVPTLLSFEATTTNTLYNTTNSTIVIKATMNEDIMSGDTITIVLNTGNSVILTANSDSTTLEGNYTVGIGEAAQPLNVLNFTSSITDLAGNEFQNNVLPNINLIDSNISIDTLRPTVLSISSSGAYQDSDDYNITVIFDQELNISTLDATSMNLNVDLNVTGTTETVVAMHQSSQIIGEQTHALYSFVVLSNHLDTDGPVVTSVNDFDNITNNQNINLDYDLNSLLLDGKIVGANPSLIGFEINDTDNSETYNAGDTIVLTFSSILKINTFTTNGITFSNGYELAANNITPNENSNTYILTLGESSNLNANDVITISKDNIEDTFGNFALNDGIVLLSDLARPSFALANAIEVFDEDNTSTYSQGDTIDITFSEMIKVSDFSNTVIDGLSAYSITQENGGSNEYYYKFTITLNDNLSTLTNNGGSVLVFSKDNIIDEDNLSPNMDLNITVPNIIKIASTDINVTHASDGYSVGDTVSLYFNVEVNASELTTSDILIDGTALSDSSITKHTNYIDIIIGSSDLMYFVEDSIISISSNFIFDADGIQMINTAQYTLPDITAPTGSSESALPGDLNDNDTLDEGDTLTLLFSEVIDTSLINLTNIATVSDVNFGTGATVNTDNTYDSEIVITLGNDTNASGATITIPQEQIIDNVENEALNDISFSVINLNTPIIDDIIIDDNAYGSGDEINVTVLFSKNIDVTENGVITIDLKIGSSTVKATYNENNISSNNMVFTYYASGVIDTDGIDVIANSITTNGSTIKFSSYDANLNFVTKNFPGATVYAPFSVSTASAVWFDGTDVDGDGDTTNQTSGSISQWNDKSGNNNHVEQSDSSLQPILQSDSSFTNNKVSVYFNGSNYMLVRGNQIGSNVSYSWFVSAYSARTSDNRDFGSVFNTRSGIDGATLYARENNDGNMYVSYIRGEDSYKVETNGDIDYNNSMILGDSVVAGSYRNLYYKGEKTQKTTVSNIYQGEGMAIGASSSTGSGVRFYLYGYVNEILFYNRALTDAETVIVQNYIASKWNNEIDSSANYYDGDENAIGDYDDYVTGIVKLSTSAIDAGKQGGVTIVNDGFVQAAGDSILIGNKGDDSIVFDSTFYPSSTNYKKLNKTWYMDIKSNTVDNEGGIKLIFDLSKLNSISEDGSASDYALMYASNENGVYTKIANASSMDGSNIEFELTAKTSGTIHENGDTITTGYFTISSSNDSLLDPVTDFYVTSTSFDDEGVLPNKYAFDQSSGVHTPFADRLNVSPQLTFNNPPAGTTHYAIIIDDDDVDWIHWNAFGIDVNTNSIDENWSSNPTGIDVVQLDSDSVAVGAPAATYTGPHPSNGMHTYSLKVYALDSNVIPPTPMNISDFESNYNENILESEHLTFTFTFTFDP